MVTSSHVFCGNPSDFLSAVDIILAAMEMVNGVSIVAVGEPAGFAPSAKPWSEEIHSLPRERRWHAGFPRTFNPSPGSKRGAFRALMSALATLFMILFAIRFSIFGGGLFDFAMVLLFTLAIGVQVLYPWYRRRKEARSKDEHLVRPRATNVDDPLKDVLNRNLVRIDDNWSRRCQTLWGRITRPLRKDQAVVFVTGSENVALVLAKDGRATLEDYHMSKRTIELEGPEYDMLTMLENARDIRSVPGPIGIRVRGREVDRADIDYMLRDSVAKTLRTLFA